MIAIFLGLFFEKFFGKIIQNRKCFDTMINYREIRPEQSDKPCVYFRWNHLSTIDKPGATTRTGCV